MRKAATAIMLALILGGTALADTTASRPEIVNGSEGWITHDRNDVLLIETTSSAVMRALNDLGVAYDYFSGSDFSGIDLSGYTHVIVAMDGGLVDDPSIANAAAFAGTGGHVHFYGGTCWQDYAIAMDVHLLSNLTYDYCWTTVGGHPHSSVVDAGHYLACNLPATYDFIDISATYYSLRSDDTEAQVAAVNGDGWDHLLSKAIGSGTFDICLNSPYDAYYYNPSDYAWLTQVVSNMLGEAPSPVSESSWGEIKALYR